MALPAEEIRTRLSDFASRWDLYDRSEREGAQRFLIDLLRCYGTEVGDDIRFEFHQEGKFLDLYWPRNCIIEMKAPSEAKKLAKHRKQAFDYWRQSGDSSHNEPAPKYIVLCAFSTFEIWEPGAYPVGDDLSKAKPRAVIDLKELPERYDALLFLSGGGRTGVFTGSQQQVTREAVGKVSELFHRLADRNAARERELQDFILQSVWCMFAEDLGMIPAHGLTTILEKLIDDPSRSSADDLGGLFRSLNTPDSKPRHGMYEGVPYANGGLFEAPAVVHLEPDELELMLSASREYQWDKVEPSIFGSLLEGGLGRSQQWALGAHYTHQADIDKIVQPTIVRPWQERIAEAQNLKDALRLRRELMQYVVLDPACGSGNFLYVAYRALRRIERDINSLVEEMRTKKGGELPEGMEMGSYPLQNIKGIELEPWAVKLARVTLWMGHKLAVNELKFPEDTLPLADLSGIQSGDALRTAWPRADAIIGNPPFHGSQRLRRALGKDYVDWLVAEYGIGVKDYCVYWFRKAHDHLENGNRAGLVGTNSVSQNRARSESLDYLAAHGGVITDAVSKQPWPGDAVTNVSIVNWVKNPKRLPDSARLDGQEVLAISSSLKTPVGSGADPVRLVGNRQRSFQGVTPSGSGFVLTADEAEELLSDGTADYAEVVKPYLDSRDIGGAVGAMPSRFIIDFSDWPLEQAEQYPSVMRIVRERVKPVRDKTPNERNRAHWWQFERPRPAMRKALQGFDTFVVGTMTGTRIHFSYSAPPTLPSNLVNAFAFDRDELLGVMLSSIHQGWAEWRMSSMRTDPRYTPTSVFETFPFPVGSAWNEQVSSITAALLAERHRNCRSEGIGLTTLYTQVDDGAWSDLRDLHRQLDEAVAEAYGWPRNLSQDADETNRRLLDLNLAIDAGKVEYDPFAYLRGPSA